MNLHIFTTGEGSPYGLGLVPVVKISSRTALAEKWRDLIDIDAGRIATGRSTIEQVGWEIFHFILDVASGRKKTWADHWGRRVIDGPRCAGPSLVFSGKQIGREKVRVFEHFGLSPNMYRNVAPCGNDSAVLLFARLPGGADVMLRAAEDNQREPSGPSSRIQIGFQCRVRTAP